MVPVMEPWDGLRHPLPDLYESLRQEVLQGKLSRGRLRLDLVEQSGRVVWQRDGEREFAVRANNETLIGLKWPTYWQLLGQLQDTRVLVCVRDPAEVVTSFAKQPGRLSRGLDYDVAFNRQLNKRLLKRYATDADRRVGLYDEVYSRVLQHADDESVFCVRYERWFEEPEALLGEIGEFLLADLSHPMVRIEAPESRPSHHEASAIRRSSSTAAALGYL